MKSNKHIKAIFLNVTDKKEYQSIIECLQRGDERKKNIRVSTLPAEARLFSSETFDWKNTTVKRSYRFTALSSSKNLSKVILAVKCKRQSPERAEDSERDRCYL